jgi:hypothetical protein
MIMTPDDQSPLWVPLVGDFLDGLWKSTPYRSPPPIPVDRLPLPPPPMIRHMHNGAWLIKGGEAEREGARVRSFGVSSPWRWGGWVPVGQCISAHTVY